MKETCKIAEQRVIRTAQALLEEEKLRGRSEERVYVRAKDEYWVIGHVYRAVMEDETGRERTTEAIYVRGWKKYKDLGVIVVFTVGGQKEEDEFMFYHYTDSPLFPEWLEIEGVNNLNP